METEILFCGYFFGCLSQRDLFEDVFLCLCQQMIFCGGRGWGRRDRSRKQQIADMIADIPLFA